VSCPQHLRPICPPLNPIECELRAITRQPLHPQMGMGHYHSPGVDVIAAPAILGEIGTAMSRFGSAPRGGRLPVVQGGRQGGRAQSVEKAL
jgi:hypothetical protein